MQLVSSDAGPGTGKIGLLNPNDKSERVWSAEQVRNKAGVEPEQIVDWLSLMGDSVDNIPGVPGVGPKTATDLLRQFGSVAELYRRLGEVKSERIRGALRVAETDVRRNQGLVRLRDDLDCDAARLTEWAVQPVDAARLAGLYRGWGFRSLLAELEAAETRQQTLI
jgi:DNA polymerase I